MLPAEPDCQPVTLAVALMRHPVSRSDDAGVTFGASSWRRGRSYADAEGLRARAHLIRLPTVSCRGPCAKFRKMLSAHHRSAMRWIVGTRPTLSAMTAEALIATVLVFVVVAGAAIDIAVFGPHDHLTDESQGFPFFWATR